MSAKSKNEPAIKTSKSDADWMQDMVAEKHRHLRRQIVQAVRSYCIQSGSRYEDTWRAIYLRFETWTGIELQEGRGTKLDLVAGHDMLDELWRVVRQALDLETYPLVCGESHA